MDAKSAIREGGKNPKGRVSQGTKTDEISEKFQMAFDPSLIFEKLCCNFFQETSKKPYIKVQDLQHKFLDWKWRRPFGSFPKIHPFW